MAKLITKHSAATMRIEESEFLLIFRESFAA
jgi:hypothetical protein